MKLFSVFVAALAAVLLVSLQFLESWTVIEHALESLRSQGSFGTFLAGLLVSRVTPLVLALVALTIGLEAWSKKRERDRGSEGASPSKTGFMKADSQITGSGNPSAVATGGSVVKHYHFPPTSITPTQGPASSPMASDAGEANKAARGPNLEYTGSREREVFVSPESQRGICDPLTPDERHHSLQALVLKFENKVPGRNIVRARNVIAKARFQSEDGVTQRQIDYGVWLNSQRNAVDIGIGDTRELVLLSMMDGFPHTFEDRRGDGNRWMPEFSWVDSANVDGLSLVEVTLIDQDTQHVLTLKLKVWFDGSRFCVALR